MTSRFCKDCRYCLPQPRTHGIARDAVCAKGPRNLVTGEIDALCRDMRLDFLTRCGEEARWFRRRGGK